MDFIANNIANYLNMYFGSKTKKLLFFCITDCLFVTDQQTKNTLNADCSCILREYMYLDQSSAVQYGSNVGNLYWLGSAMYRNGKYTPTLGLLLRKHKTCRNRPLPSQMNNANTSCVTGLVKTQYRQSVTCLNHLFTFLHDLLLL